MILSGAKKEEYREVKPYWNSRLWSQSGYNSVTFSNGYSKDRRQMEVKLIGYRKGIGNPEWGAMPNTEYHILEFGEIISTTRCDFKIPSCDVLSQRNDSGAAVCGKCEMLGYLGPCDEHYYKGMAVFD